MSTDQETPSAPPDGPQLFEPGDRVDKRYEVVRLIAQGGMGLVYEVVDLELSATLALKAVKPHIARQSQTLDRFQREIRLSSRITHPNVCRLFGAGLHRESSGLEVHYLTMELLEGETLSRRLRESGPLDPEEAGPILQQMASGLAAAHRSGVVHRDLKCSNVILVPREDPEGSWRAVITDFGLSRSLIHEEETSRLTATGQLMGTPAYFAPELLDGHRLTAASDVYGFGVVAYEMLSGELPFTGRSPFVVALRRLSEPPRPIRQLVPGLDPHWVRVLDRCLQRRPEDRPADGAALLEMVERPSPGEEAETRSEPKAATSRDLPIEGWDLDGELAALTEGGEPRENDPKRETDLDPWGSEAPFRPRDSSPRAPRSPWRLGLAIALLIVVAGGIVLLGLASKKTSPRPLRLAVVVAELAGEGGDPVASEERTQRVGELRLALRWAASDRRDLALVSHQTLAPLRGEVVDVARAAAADEVVVGRLLSEEGAWRIELERFSDGGTRRVWARGSTVPQGGTRLLAHAIAEDLDRAFEDHPPRGTRWDPLQEGGEVFDELLQWNLRLERWIADPESVEPPSAETLESIRRRSGDALASRRLEARWQLALARRSETPRSSWRQASSALLALDPRPSDLLALAMPLGEDPSDSELELLRELLERPEPDIEEGATGGAESCDGLQLRAHLDFHSGAPEAARDGLRDAVNQCPAWDVLADLARVERSLGDREAASESYRRALALAPGVESLRRRVAELTASGVER